MNYKITTNKVKYKDILKHLQECSDQFTPPLNSYVNIEDYSLRLSKYCNAIAIQDKKKIIGLLAYYVSNSNKEIYISNLSVYNRYQNLGLGTILITELINNSINQKILLKVNLSNRKAIKFYKKNGFRFKEKEENNLILEHIPNLKNNTDLDKKIKDTTTHKYAYGFDFDVMHNYMLKSMQPYFKPGNVLELGSFKGDFTEKLQSHFKNITCVEGSKEAYMQAILRSDIGQNKIINMDFFDDKLPEKIGWKYNNIILTHVLEHMEEPVKLIELIKDKFLMDDGLLFIVCPNANAASRQIAVEMGLIPYNSAITVDEREHGHYITYTMDTLKRDIKKGGLEIVHSSGIFFKALANFQWDKLLKTDIISKEYLDGCYELGKKYPDLCSSLFMVCKK